MSELRLRIQFPLLATFACAIAVLPPTRARLPSPGTTATAAGSKGFPLMSADVARHANNETSRVDQPRPRPRLVSWM